MEKRPLQFSGDAGSAALAQNRLTVYAADAKMYLNVRRCTSK